MKSEIISKLKSALAEPIKKECQVVYILAEIRKLLEILKDKKSFPVLNFYGNWVLHTKIDDTSAVRSLLEKIEQSILSKEYDIWTVMKIIDFDEFRKEMEVFLNKFDINNNFFNPKYWRSFRRIFVSILADCPLKPDYGNIKEFCFINSSGKDNVDFVINFRNRRPLSGSFTLK